MGALRKKGKSRRGFSLAETLVAILILSFLSSAAALGVSQALWQRNKSIALADAQTVASTAAQLITDQLRYGQISHVEPDGETIVLKDGSIRLDERGYLTIHNGGTDYKPLGVDAYCHLHLSELEFAMNPDGSVNVKLSVARDGETDSPDNSLWNLEFSVSPLNGKAE